MTKTSDRKYNIHRMIMSSGFRVLSNVFITIINPNFKKKSRITRKNLKKYFSQFKKKKNNDSNQNQEKYEKIEFLLNIKFKYFLIIADFPFKDEKCSIKYKKIKKEIKENKEERITNLKKQEKIFLNRLEVKNYNRSQKKKKKNYDKKKNYYDETFNRRDNGFLLFLLEQKCENIINYIINSKDEQAQFYKQYLKMKSASQSKNQNKNTTKPLFKVIRDNFKNNNNVPSNNEQVRTNENLDIFNNNFPNIENNKNDSIFFKEKQINKNISTNFSTGKDELIKENKDFYILNGVYLSKSNIQLK